MKYKLVNATFIKYLNLPCFRNESKCKPFNGVIGTFSLDTERLIQEYSDVELQLIFLKTEVRMTIVPSYPLIHYQAVCPGLEDLSRSRIDPNIKFVTKD